jgi:hypothetical protein
VNKHNGETVAVKTFNQAQGSYLAYHYHRSIIIIIIVYFLVLDVHQATIKFSSFSFPDFPQAVAECIEF